VDRIDTTFTSKDFHLYWKKANERTLSSISGLHFGHYKMAIKCIKLGKLHAVFINIAVNSRYSPRRWQKGLTGCDAGKEEGSNFGQQVMGNFTNGR
jgi:hypothetical protein